MGHAADINIRPRESSDGSTDVHHLHVRQEDTMRALLLAASIVGSLAFTPAMAEPHPHLAAAITELQAARQELQTAANDFGGHKAKAIKAVDNAIKQLKEAQKFDK